MIKRNNKGQFVKGSISSWNSGTRKYYTSVCKECGLEFKHIRLKRLFCDIKCYAAYRAKNMNEFSWKHDVKHSVKSKEMISNKIKQYIATPAGQAGIRRAGLLGARTLYKRNPTKLELKLNAILDKEKITYETQKLINGKFLVDAYIPSLNLIIEVDGDYWHNLDRIKKKDKAENAYLTKCGFSLIRIKENEIDSFSLKGGEHYISL